MKVPFAKALKIILLSSLIVSGSAALGLYYFQYIKWRQGHNDKYKIVAIAQTCSAKEALKTVYLAELLDLSVDRPVNLYHFNTEAAENRLLKSPLIKSVEVKKIPPGTVYIDYVSRNPIAYLIDYTNTALDDEGVPIPFNPFFTPKNLPEIYLGLDPEEQNQVWGIPLKDKKTKLALELLHFANLHLVGDNSHLRRIDVSQAFASSYGQRQVVIIIEDRVELDSNGTLATFPRILRLNSDSYPQELAHYQAIRDIFIEKEKKQDLKSNLRGEPKIVDLRIPHLAFIKER